MTVLEQLESRGGVKTPAILDMSPKEVGALCGTHRLGEKVTRSQYLEIYETVRRSDYLLTIAHAHANGTRMHALCLKTS